MIGATQVCTATVAITIIIIFITMMIIIITGVTDIDHHYYSYYYNHFFVIGVQVLSRSIIITTVIITITFLLLVFKYYPGPPAQKLQWILEITVPKADTNWTTQLYVEASKQQINTHDTFS